MCALGIMKGVVSGKCIGVIPTLSEGIERFLPSAHLEYTKGNLKIAR